MGKSKPNSELKGRPTHQQQVKMLNVLRKEYDKGYSVDFTSRKTGYNKNTIQSYFKEWTEALIDKTDFITQQMEAKVRLVESLNTTIETLNEQQDFIISKRTTKFNPALENSLTKVNHALAKLHIDKATVLMTPTLDVSLRKLIKDKWGVDIEKIEPETIPVNGKPDQESQ